MIVDAFKFGLPGVQPDAGFQFATLIGKTNVENFGTNGVKKIAPGVTGTYDASAYTQDQKAAGSFRIRAYLALTAKTGMIGINTVADAPTVIWTNIKGAILALSSDQTITLFVYENGAQVANLGVFAAVGDSIEIEYDGTAMKYKHKGVLLLTRNQVVPYPICGDVSFDSVGMALDRIQFATS